MASPYSSILRGINRSNDGPLNILLTCFHEAYQTQLAKTGHNFFLLQSPKLKQWDCTNRPIPWDIQLIAGDGKAFTIKHDMVFDMVLCGDKSLDHQILLQSAMQFQCPIIGLDIRLPIPEWNRFQVEHLADLQCDHRVFSSEDLANQWGFDAEEGGVTIIDHGIDTNFWSGWSGGSGKVLAVVNRYRGRNPANKSDRSYTRGFELWEAISKKFDTELCGDTPGLSIKTRDQDSLLSKYQRSDVFVNTSRWTDIPFSMLEAMSVGIPVVTTSNLTINSFINNGNNGFIADDIDSMERSISSLLRHKDMAATIGAAGRNTIISKFNEKTFVDKWSTLLRSVSGKPICSWIQ